MSEDCALVYPKIILGYCAICRDPITSPDDHYNPDCCEITMCQGCFGELCDEDKEEECDDWKCKDCTKTHDLACSSVEISKRVYWWKISDYGGPREHCDNEGISVWEIVQKRGDTVCNIKLINKK